MVELLEMVIENVTPPHAPALLQQAQSQARSKAPSTDRLPAALAADTPHDNPQVAAALRTITDHLSNPEMNVATVARDLNLNASYLAHLFATHTGVRMSRYIACHRIELAKKLLARTNWQIKRVAFESGHRNVDWFGESFRAHTGVSPTRFRCRDLQANRSSFPN